MQTPPMSVIKIAITIATIGLRTKNSDMGASGIFLRGRTVRGDLWLPRRRPFFHCDRCAFARLLHALHNNSVSGVQAFGDLPHRANAFAHFYRTNADLVILIDHRDLEISLQLSYRFLWNNERIVHRVRDEPHLPKLSRPQGGVWIWKRYIVAD